MCVQLMWKMILYIVIEVDYIEHQKRVYMKANIIHIKCDKMQSRLHAWHKNESIAAIENFLWIGFKYV